jgi:hypothetical protein
MKFWYDNPTQVIFQDEQAAEENRNLGGIAFRNFIICMECGAVIEPEDVTMIVDLPWVSVMDEVLGDE